MRAFKTFFSISFLFLAATIVAEDQKGSNEFPDEIKNLNLEFIGQLYWALYPAYPKKAFKSKIQGDV